MRNAILGTLAASLLLGGCASYDGGVSSNQPRRYDYNRPDPAYGSYDASRYYRDDANVRERRLSNRERVYRGNDDRYYCRRRDGSTGLIIGANCSAESASVLVSAAIICARSSCVNSSA